MQAGERAETVRAPKVGLHGARRPEWPVAHALNFGSDIERVRATQIDVVERRRREVSDEPVIEGVARIDQRAQKEALALQMDRRLAWPAVSLFESSWKKPYSERGVRRMPER